MVAKIKITERDKRALKLGAIGAVVILVFILGSSRYDKWRQSKLSMDRVQGKLDTIKVDKRRQAGVLSIVPVFEMPKEEEEQKFLFRDKVNEQMKKLGIKSKPLEILGVGKKVDGYKSLRIKCTARCRFTQVMDLLAALNENPYLVAVEELRIRVDAKKRQEVDMDIVVSTFAK